MQMAARTLVAEFSRCIRTGETFADWPDMIELFPMVAPEDDPNSSRSGAAGSTSVRDKQHVPPGYVLASGRGLAVDLKIRR